VKADRQAWVSLGQIASFSILFSGLTLGLNAAMLGGLMARGFSPEQIYHFFTGYLHSPFRWGLLGFPSLLLIFLWWRVVGRRDWVSLGFSWGPGAGQDLIFGIFFGLLLAGAEFMILRGLGGGRIIGFTSRQGQPGWLVVGTFLVYAGALGVSAITQELIGRGYLLRNFLETVRPGPAVVASAVWTVVLVAPNPYVALDPGTLLEISPGEVFRSLVWYQHPDVAPWALVNRMLLGLLLGGLSLGTGNLWAAVGCHAAWLMARGLVFSLPLSGMRGLEPLLCLQMRGPALITGGSGGPDGGLLSTAVLLGGICLSEALLRGARVTSLKPHGPDLRPAHCGGWPKVQPEQAVDSEISTGA